MLQWILTLGGFALMAGVVLALVGSQRRQRALGRLEDQGMLERGEAIPGMPRGAILVRRRWISIAVGTAVAVVASLILLWPVWLSIAIGFVVASVAWIVEDFVAGSRELRVEEQCADSIDLCVSALKSGMSLV